MTVLGIVAVIVIAASFIDLSIGVAVAMLSDLWRALRGTPPS